MQVNLLYRPSQSLAQCWLQEGETLVAESGAMVGMSANVELEPQSDGLLGGIKRLFGGESFYRNHLTAKGAPGEVLLAPPLCGDMTLVEVGRSQWCLHSGAFVASSPSVSVEPSKGGWKSKALGGSFFLLETSGQGQLVFSSFGAIEPVRVQGEMIVDTGHVAAWETSLTYEIRKATSGWLASWLSGEGFVARFTGEGLLFVQTRNAEEFGRTLGNVLPARG